jgi:hypothetical protein
MKMRNINCETSVEEERNEISNEGDGWIRPNSIN